MRPLLFARAGPVDEVTEKLQVISPGALTAKGEHLPSDDRDELTGELNSLQEPRSSWDALRQAIYALATEVPHHGVCVLACAPAPSKRVPGLLVI